MLSRSLFLAALLCAEVLPADDLLQPGEPRLDRPTLTALGIQLPIAGDDNKNAAVTVRYRVQGEESWHDALPLFRVRPDTVVGWTVQPQFAGSLFDLRPATTYEIELHAVDPDGLDRTFLLTAGTRAVPGDPVSPRDRPVSDAAGLRAALRDAQPGDVITLADGVYAGTFFINKAGTPENPIVIRGASVDGVILDGNNCPTCNVLEVYNAGFVHVERLTIRNAARAIRFQTPGAEGNVVRRVRTQDTRLGIGSREDQKDFYICDNELQGRLQWPSIYSDDRGAHANDDGIRVQGFGHVVCYNRLSGFGDALKVEQNGARAIDFYGNDVLFTYDNGIELDDSEGNVRALRNRFTNTNVPLSVQPIYGGPAYLIRNVAVNVVNEQMKFHALGGTPLREPNGIFAYHNTFVSPGVPLNLQTGAATHHFVVANNLFVGPAARAGSKVVDWTGRVNDGIFDYNGYFPDGIFTFNLPALGGFRNYNGFSAMQEGGLEHNGVLLGQPIFASGLQPPASYTEKLDPQDATLDPQSNALDRGMVLPNINDWYTGAAPDLGALEQGCLPPTYGPRPEGVDESNQALGCGGAPPSPPADQQTAEGSSASADSPDPQQAPDQPPPSDQPPPPDEQQPPDPAP